MLFSLIPTSFDSEARPHSETSYLIAPSEGALLMGEIDLWWQRAQQWYTLSSEADVILSLKEKRAQMRHLSKAVGRGCYDCHTKGFKGYDDKGLISAQMMAISAEHQVPCEHCHVGARGLTRLGGWALLMWRYSVEEGLDCADCHPYKTQFKQLNAQGKQQKEKVKQALLKLCDRLNLPTEILSVHPTSLPSLP